MSTEEEEFIQALRTLRLGEILCIPTESSYGLAVDASNHEAIEKLALLKGRGKGIAIGLIAGSTEQAMEWTLRWPKRAVSLALAHWPGPLTLVLPPTVGISPRLLGPSGGVALRVSSRPLLRSLALELGQPITATSANPSGQPAATTREQARLYFGDRIDMYVDGGPCTGLPSTLVDFDAAGQPRILRSGPIALHLEEQP